MTGADAPVPTADGPVDWPVLEAMALSIIEHGVSVILDDTTVTVADTLDDARRIIAAQQATGRRAFVDMFSRFSPAS